MRREQRLERGCLGGLEILWLVVEKYTGAICYYAFLELGITELCQKMVCSAELERSCALRVFAFEQKLHPKIWFFNFGAMKILIDGFCKVGTALYGCLDSHIGDELSCGANIFLRWKIIQCWLHCLCRNRSYHEGKGNFKY